MQRFYSTLNILLSVARINLIKDRKFIQDANVNDSTGNFKRYIDRQMELTFLE